MSKSSGGGASARSGGKSKSGGGSIAVTKTKERKTKEMDENIYALRLAIFNDDGTDKDVTAGISPAFMKYQRNGLDCNIELLFKLSQEDFEWAFEITKNNMEDIYDKSGYGWDDEDKEAELNEKAQGSRFLVVRETGWNNPIAFVNFRFSVLGDFMDNQQGDKALIILDIHVEEEFQRRGLAKHLMILLELIARREKMQYVALSIYLGDTLAKSWLDKSTKGYCIDPSLEQTIGFVSDMEGFDIYTKKLELLKPKQAAPVVAKKTIVDTPVVNNNDVELPETVLANLTNLALNSAVKSETDDDWELVNPPTPTKDINK